MILDSAYRIHVHTCDKWRGLPVDPRLELHLSRLAQPFGRPVGMPEHRWRVSWDVMQALYEAAPPPKPVPNPKTSEGPMPMLFGWPVDRDDAAPVGTLLLEQIP